MAEIAGLNSSLQYPIYGVPYALVFPILDADGDLVTGAAGLDSEVSLDGDTFADCNPGEAAEIATSSGMYYLILTAAEMSANVVTVIVKTSTSGAKTTPIVLYPRVLPKVRSSTATAGAAGTITLDAGASAKDDFYNGCVVHITGGTGIGQVRVITDYTGSNKQAAVTPNWTTNPDVDSTIDIYFTDQAVSLVAWAGAIVPDPDTVGYPKTTIKDGTGTGEVDTDTGKISIARPTGAVATDGSNAATAFKTTLTQAVDNYWNGCYLKLTSGDMINQVRKITDYDGTSKFVTVDPALTGTPADAVTFLIINE